jgi:hypothetical protein
MKEMKRVSFFAAALLFGIAGCAQPERNVQTAKAAPVGARFEAIGRVALHTGQPCTSQIMFDFNARGSSRPVYLAARMRQSKILTDAANGNRNVHVSGTWQRGKTKGCSYVNVAEVEQ